MLRPTTTFVGTTPVELPWLQPTTFDWHMKAKPCESTPQARRLRTPLLAGVEEVATVREVRAQMIA